MDLTKIDLTEFSGTEQPLVPPQDPLRSTLSEAVKVNPDQQANLQRLSRQSGVPQFAVESNPDEVQTALNLKNINLDSLVKDSPKTAEFLQDWNNASVIHDDIKPLEEIEKWFRFGRTFENVGATAKLGFKEQAAGVVLRGADQMPSRIEDIIPPSAFPLGVDPSGQLATEMSREFAGNFGITTDEELQQAKEEGIQQMIGHIRELQSERKALTPDDLNTLEQGVRAGVDSLINMAPGIGLTILSGGRAAPMLMTMGVQTYGSSYADARAEGLDTDTAGWYATIDAAIEVGTEILPVGTLEKIITGGAKGQLTKEALRFAVREMGTEQLATLGQSLNAYLFGLDEQLNNAESVEEMVQIQLQRQAVTAIATVVAGGAQITATTTLRKGIEKITAQTDKQISEGQVEQNRIDQLNKNATDSKLKERDPEKFRQFVEQSDGDNNSSVYIDGAQVSLYLQTKTQEEIAADPGLQRLQEQASEAAALGGDVVVPVADFATDLAGTEHFEALRPHMTLSAESISPFRQEQVQAETQSYIEGLMNEAEQNVSEYVESQQIFETVRQQLVDSGAYNDQNAKIMAQVVPAWATVFAKKNGITVQEAYDAFGFKVEGPQTGRMAELTGSDVLTQKDQYDILDDLLTEYFSAELEADLSKPSAELKTTRIQKPEYDVAAALKKITSGGITGLTDNRISNLMREYGYSNGTVKGTLVNVNPQDFVNATHSKPSEIKAETGKLDIEKMRSETQTPYLEVSGGKIVGHEGRHRLQALANAGVTSVPVVVVNKDYSYTTKESGFKEGDVFSGQFDGTSDITISNPVDIAYANRKTINESFGKGDILYQPGVEPEPAPAFAPSREDVMDTFEKHGGVSFSMPGVLDTGDTGYIATLMSEKWDGKADLFWAFRTFVNKHARLLKYDNVILGMYRFKDGSVSFDFNVLIEDRDEAVQIATDNDQEAIYDRAADDLIDTGGTGGTGLSMDEAELVLRRKQGLPDEKTYPEVVSDDYRERFDAARERGETGLEGAIDRETGDVNLVHFSHTAISRTAPELWGRNLSGRTPGERDRIAQGAMGRTFFALETTEDPYKKEAGLGNIKSEFSIPGERLYPLNEDPLNLYNADKLNETEERIRDAGFAGYWVNNPRLGKVAAIFEPLDAKPREVFEQRAVKPVPSEVNQVANLDAAFTFARSQPFKTNRDFKIAMQKMVSEAAGRIDLTEDTPRVAAYLKAMGLQDAIVALRDNSDAVGWYDEKVTKATRVLSLIHPEIMTDEKARFAFTWALAITSNGLKVDKNFELAEKAYTEYKQTGKMPEKIGIGDASDSINKSMKKFNDLMSSMGYDDFSKLMTSKATVKEIEAATGYSITGEGKQTVVYGAAIAGPKIGNGFFANLYGNFEQLTMDRWFMRTWGRWIGKLVEVDKTKVKDKSEKLNALIDMLPAAEKTKLKKLIKTSIAKTKVKDTSVAIMKASMKKPIRDAMIEIGVIDSAETTAKLKELLGTPKKNAVRYSIGDEIRKLGNGLAKDMDGQIEAPGGVTQRNQIRSVMNEVLAELNQQYPDLTMADLQALLWYPEKRLYDASKSKEDAASASYEEDEAPDYANAAVDLARQKGISEAAITKTIKEVDDELSAKKRSTGVRRGGLGVGDSRRIADQNGQIFYQEPVSEGTRGYYSPSEGLIRLTEAADLSTFLHEFAHFMYEMELTSGSETIQSINNWFRRNAESVAKEANDYAPNTTILASHVEAYLDNGTAGDKERDDGIRRAVHEQFARGFETYLMEGKAPSIELRNAFRAFARWLTTIYKAIKGDLKVNLDDEMRQVFDRLLATEEQIAAAEARARYAPMFTDATMAGMTEQEWTDYQKRQEKVKDKQTETLRDKLISEITRATKRWWKEEKSDVEDEVTAQLQKERVYVARDRLKTGDIKLDRATVKEMVGEEFTDKRGRKFNRVPPALNGMHEAGGAGIHPDEAAAVFGYGSGSEMIKDLMEAENIKDVAEARAEQIMLERHGDILNDGTIEQQADEAVQNEERGRFMLHELKILSRGTNVKALERQAIKDMAERRIGQLSYRQINPGKYRKAEIKAAQEAAKMLAEGNKEGAAAAKTRQVVNYYLGMAATEARTNTDKIVDRMGRYRKKNVREEIQKAGNEYWEQITKILERFEFRKGVSMKKVDQINTDINSWMKARIEEDGDALVLSNAVLNESYVTHWKNVAFADLQGIYDSVRNIEHVARYSNKITRLQEEMDFKELVQKWVTHINDKVETKFKSQRTDVIEGRKWGQWAMAQMTKIPYMARWLDGGETAGLSHQILMQPFTDAYDAEIKLWGDVGRPVLEMIEQRSKGDIKRHNRKIFIPEIKDENNDGNLYGHQILSIALNTGNQSNLRKLLLGEGWASPEFEDQISFDNPKLQAVLRHMTENDWKLVQSIWDNMETLYPMLAEVHRKTTGLTPPKVEATPVQTPYGEFKGGYYPVKYDPNRSQRAMENEDKLNAQTESMFSNNASIQASVNAGATNERTGYYAPIRLSLDVVPAHFQETIHYITHHDAVREVNKLIRNPSVAKVITEKLGAEEYAQLRPWLNDIAKDGREAPTKMFWDSILQRLRFGVTLGAMGFKASTGLMQLLGLSNTVAEVGIGPVMQSARSILGSTTTMREAWGFASSNSKVLNHRAQTMDREIKNAMQRVEGKRGFMAAVQEASMKHIALIQTYMVDLPSWQAAYIKAMKEHGDEQRAYQYADWVVENIQGSGATKDMARIMRGQTETGRMFTMFMTFFSSLWNMERDLVRGARSGQYSYTSVAAKSMFIFVIPVFLEMLMRGEFGGDDDPEKELQTFLTKTALYPVQSVPFLRDIANATTGDYGYNITPMQQILEQGTRTIPELMIRPFTDEEITKGQVKGATKFIGAATGIPGTGQAWATGEHLYDVMADGEDLTIRELLFGPKKD